MGLQKWMCGFMDAIRLQDSGATTSHILDIISELGRWAPVEICGIWAANTAGG